MITYVDKQTGETICQADNGPEIEWIVKAVTAEDDYVLLIDFADGKRKRFDMGPLIAKGGIFGRLNDINYFKRAHVDRGTVAWDDMVDIAPESLYNRGILVADH